jgi:chorismate mutase
MPSSKISELRGEIDRLNAEILARIQQRAELVREISRLKRSRGMEDRDLAREQAMLAQLFSTSPGPLEEPEIRAIFQAIFDASIALMSRTGPVSRDPEL